MYESLDPQRPVQEEDMADPLYFVQISDTHLGHIRKIGPCWATILTAICCGSLKP